MLCYLQLMGYIVTDIEDNDNSTLDMSMGDRICYCLTIWLFSK